MFKNEVRDPDEGVTAATEAWRVFCRGARKTVREEGAFENKKVLKKVEGSNQRENVCDERILRCYGTGLARVQV